MLKPGDRIQRIMTGLTHGWTGTVVAYPRGRSGEPDLTQVVVRWDMDDTTEPILVAWLEVLPASKRMQEVAR